MTRYLWVIVIIAMSYITSLLKKNIDNKRTKSVILISPFVLGGIA